MSESHELEKLINNMGALLVLNTQVSMDGSVERKKNDILCRQRGVIKAINELKAKDAEIADFKRRNGNMNHGMAKDLQKIAKQEKEIEELKAFKEDITDIINGSEGVAGWHNNGEVALWHEFGLEGESGE